jgi:NADH-quinone oxidoreductase subunit L
MGGLWKKLPVTFAVTTVGVLAIAGFPPFAGFFSKDAILYAAFLQGPNGRLLWAVGVVTALLTSFYMFRLWTMAFMGKPRGDDAVLHESPWSMRGPLLILALLSVCGGWIGIERAGGWLNMERFTGFLAPVVGARGAEGGSAQLELTLSAVAVGVALVGWLLAYLFYRERSTIPARVAGALPHSYKLLANKYYVDELYGAAVVKPLLGVSRYFLGWVVEVALLGGIASLLAGGARFAGAILQYWQSGNLRSYAAWLTAGAAAVLLFLLVPWGTVWPASMEFVWKATGH